MDLRDGYLTVGRWRGAPVRLHWSIPIGALVLTGGVRPAAWLGFVLIVLVHEMGHAAMVRALGARPLSVDVHGLGGQCAWTGAVSPLGRACIAFAGVWAQLALLAAARVARVAWGGLHTPFQAQLFWTLTATNAFNAALNLLPVPPLDGAQAWQLFPLLGRRAWPYLRRAWPYLRRKRFAWRPELVRAEPMEAPEAQDRGGRADGV